MSSVDQMQREALAMLYPDALTNLDKIQASSEAATANNEMIDSRQADQEDERATENQIEEFHKFKDL